LWLIGQGDIFLPVHTKSSVACSIKMGIRLELLHFPEKKVHTLNWTGRSEPSSDDKKTLFSVMLNTIFVTDSRVA